MTTFRMLQARKSRQDEASSDPGNWMAIPYPEYHSFPTDGSRPLLYSYGKTYPSYSSWAITVSIGTSPYRKRLSEISTATIQLTQTADNLTTSIQTISNVSDPNHALLNNYSPKARISPLHSVIFCLSPMTPVMPEEIPPIHVAHATVPISAAHVTVPDED